MTDSARTDGPRFERLMRPSLFAGLVAGAVAIVMAIFLPSQFFKAYFFVYLFLLGLPLGALALVMIHHLTGGAWGLFVRRILEAQMLTLPVMVLLFVPVGIGLPHIYRWAGPQVETSDAHQSWQSHYLEPTFFFWRAVAYFVVWLALALLLGAWSRRLDQSSDVRTLWKCNQLSGVGLVLFGVALHFAVIDWVMSLQTQFTSTIIGPVVFAGQAISAYAMAVAVFCGMTNRSEFRGLISRKVMNDLGSLLFTLLVLWAYLAWFQFMLIWIADLPHGTTWYLPRLSGGWGSVALVVVLFHFVIPFFLLLLRFVKRDRRLLGGVAVLILFSQVIFDYYEVAPAFDGGMVMMVMLSAVLAVAMGGVWTATFLWQLARRPLMPLYDINVAQAKRLRRLDEEEFSREEALTHA